jgi:AmmeMemoRadiSam system protein A
VTRVARDSIAHGVEHGTALTVEPRAFDPTLREPRACFVTLHAREKLRGCVGSLEAGAPLVVETARNAYRAAFEDPRFHFVRAPELADLAVSVSILSPLEPLRVDSEAALLGAIRPGVDGLVLRGDGRSATFLPAVWRHDAREVG